MTNDNYSVYMHISPNGKKYIGITSLVPERRWQKGRGYKDQSYFYKAIQKYGWDNFKHEVPFTDLTKEEAEQKEIDLIACYQSDNRNFGYNVDRGGNSHGKTSEETKRKISQKLKGRAKPESVRKKLSESNKGKKRSEETRRKLSETHKGERNYWYGKNLDDEIRQKMSNSSKNPSIETKAKRSKSLKNQFYNIL